VASFILAARQRMRKSGGRRQMQAEAKENHCGIDSNWTLTGA
jgi:hypothetical protein